MENIPVLYLAFVLLAALLAILTVWSRRKLVPKLFAMAAFIAMVGLNYTALVNLLGRPQPIDSIAAAPIEDDAVVLAASVDEGNAIYLWLRSDEERQPRYYKMDWDMEAAIALKKAMSQSTRENRLLMMNPNYENSLEGKKEPLFYALPPERLPLKPPPELFEYRNPNNAI